MKPLCLWKVPHRVILLCVDDGAVHHFQPTTETYRCVCPTGYTGQDCGTTMNTLNQCQNGAAHTSLPLGGYNCTCANSGIDCSDDVSITDIVPTALTSTDVTPQSMTFLISYCNTLCINTVTNILTGSYNIHVCTRVSR